MDSMTGRRHSPRDAAIVLSHDLLPDGELGDVGKRRVEGSIDLFRIGTIRRLVFSGGRAQPDLPHTHAEVMGRYARSRGIAPMHIWEESASLDTVGQLVFTLRDLVIPQKWNSLTIVTSDYHLERTKLIGAFVYGNAYDVHYSGVASGICTPNLIAVEKAKHSATCATLAGTTAGDPQSLIEALRSRHSLYSSEDALTPRVRCGI